jgi:uncharacterized protein (DUF58 family)
MADSVPAPASRVLDPKLQAAVGDLTLIARKLVAGAMPGLHASRRPGLAREFSQYRAYQPGDEPRHIDWKLYARSDRYFLRESEIETKVAVRLIVDATASMGHVDAAVGARRKFDAACQLAAAFALMAEMQGDPVGLVAVNADRVVSVPIDGHRQPFARIVRALAALEPAGAWPKEPKEFTTALALNSHVAGGADTTAELTIVLTDGHEPAGEIRAALKPLRARRNEVLWLHLVGRDEREFPYKGLMRFEEWETGRQVEAEAGVVRAAYLAAQEAEVLAWRKAWAGERFDYQRVSLDEPLERTLRAYVKRRAGG